MSFQRLLDAGVHPQVISRSRATSVDPAAIISLINTILSVFTSGGGALIQELMNLLALFHILPGPSPTPAIHPDQARKNLVESGVDADLLAKAEASAVDPAAIVAWITNIMNVVTVAGPAVIQSIAAILALFGKSPSTPVPAQHHVGE